MAEPTETITTEYVVASTAVDQELNCDTLAVDRGRPGTSPTGFPD